MNGARAASLDPLEAGLAHHRAGNLAKAETAYRRVLKADAGNAAALYLLGLVALDRGRPERALQLIGKAVARDPSNPDYHHGAGSALQALGRFDDAVARYRAALAIDPERAATRSNLGNALKHAGLLDAAATELARAVEIDPGFAEGWSNLGLVEKARGHWEAAIDCCARAVALGPRSGAFHRNLGHAHLGSGDAAAAIPVLERAVALAPLDMEARASLGAALRRAGRPGDAVAILDAALALGPDHAETRWNRTLALIAAGRIAEGFADFDSRLALPGYAIETPGGARWNGEPLAGKTLLVIHEQGFGDAIQFLGLARVPAARGARVIYRGPEALCPLIARIDGIAGTSASDTPFPAHDAWVPMMSLPRLLGFGTAGRSSPTPYLAPDPERTARWRARIDAIPGLRVAIAWQGNRAYAADRARSVPLGHFAGLARIPGVSLIALQKDAGREQIAGWPATEPLHHFGAELDARGGAFMDSAAILAHADVVVSSDTALAHLAGAMGVKTLVALAQVPDWRWGLERADTVWYPSLTLYRQTAPGDWDGVFAQIGKALAQRIAAHG